MHKVISKHVVKVGVRHPLLRANTEVERKTYSPSVCEVCWTTSWAPCPPETPNAVKDGVNSWMLCQMCSSHDALAQADKARAALVKEVDRLRRAISTIREAVFDLELFGGTG